MPSTGLVSPCGNRSSTPSSTATVTIPLKQVEVDFILTPGTAPTELLVRVRDHGDGFDPDALADPLAPENILKASGRGIFFMRSFMDDVRIERAAGGGMEVRMLKRLSRP